MNTLIIDSREPRNIKIDLKKYFIEDDIHTEVQELQQGDFKYGKLLIERKEIADLNSSLHDGRIKNQTYRMLREKQEQDIHPYIIIQGSYTKLFKQSRYNNFHCMTRKQYYGLIASLNEKGINTIQLEGKGTKELYTILRALITHENTERTEIKEVLLKPCIQSYSTRCYYMIDGIGEQKAKQISDKFPLNKLIQVPEEMKNELTEIDGIGDRTADKIIKTLKGGK